MNTTRHSENKLITPFWLITWSIALSIGWLLPNHYPPWAAFHSDSWIAIGLLTVAGWIFFTNIRLVWEWPFFTLFLFFLVLIPWLQQLGGLVFFSGTTWMSTIYLMGFALAQLLGSRWESIKPNQAADGLFLAIGIAAVFSVAMQLAQWLQLTPDEVTSIWSMGPSNSRPFANFGQPNQLGTFLIWGLLSIAWGVLRGQLGRWSALPLALFLLFGIALTQSRTSWLELLACVIAVWLWRGLWPNRSIPVIVTLLFGVFWIFPLLQNHISNYLLLNSDVGLFRVQFHADDRFTIWKYYLDAIRSQPWFGYGWHQGIVAQFNISESHPPLGGLVQHAHNLFIDLLVWCGVVVGLIISLTILVWIFKLIKSINSPGDLIFALFLSVVGIHAMLELPLYYAYMLLPVGVVIGIVNQRRAASMLVWRSGPWFPLTLWISSAVLLTLLIRDYARVESSYALLRFEWAHVRVTEPKEPPEVVLLTQWREFIKFARFKPVANMSAEDLEWMRQLAVLNPSGGNFQKTVIAMVLNKRLKEAEVWQRKACKMVDESQCKALKVSWEELRQRDPRLSIPWAE